MIGFTALGRPRTVLGLAALAFFLGRVAPASAWRDTDGNKIDDAIETVQQDGWAAAFVNQDPSGRMKIGVENQGDILYAIYVGYDHRPTSLDETLLSSTGVSMVWPFQSIDYIESRATWTQVLAITALPGVTRVEAVPVEYPENHYGSRVVRSRDSRGLAAADNYALFPSVQQELGFDGTGIVIAILDTGVNDAPDQIGPGYPGHESLQGKFLGGGEFWCGQAACSTPLNGSMNPQDHGAEASSYHATHVAGSAMGTGGPEGFFAGVAPGARLVDCKVLSDAGATVGGSNRGLDWVIANRNTLWAGLSPGSIWQGIDVVNMSLGSTECATGTGTSTGAGSTLINTAVDAGLVLAIATGNDGALDCIASPAAADKSIAVGASEHSRTLDRTDDLVTDFSNEGIRDDDGDADHLDEMKPNVIAPGAGIISASGDPTTDGTAYSQLSGTSMAAPHVAGCVALLLEANPALAPMTVRAILQNTAEHNIPTAKPEGDRGQDPYGVDPNFDLSCGWGLVDMYAAVKEALDSTSGVQVVQIRAVAQPAQGRIDFNWITQREYPFQGFNVYRAPDASGAPGAFTQLNTLLIPGTGDAIIQGDDNRTPYVYPDSDPTLVLGNLYWYQVEWIDALGGSHLEPPVPAEYGTLARVATVFYSIAHNAVDNDLLVRIGSDPQYQPGDLGDADFEVLGPGERGQDSVHVELGPTTPASTGTATIGNLDHFWSVGFNQGDGAEPYLTPTYGRPWFLHVTDAGYVNRTGRVTSFSMFVNDEPGSASGRTYVTDHLPMPQPTGEFGATPAILWIPEYNAASADFARLEAAGGTDGVTISLFLVEPGVGTATVYRSRSIEFGSRVALTTEPLEVSGTDLIYLDPTAEPGSTYHYWVEFRQRDGAVTWNGPVSVTATGSARAATFAAPAWPNPLSSRAALTYTIGSDIAAHGTVPVSIIVHDIGGRMVKQLKNGPEGMGEYRVEWDATDETGSRVAAGVYVLNVRAGAFAKTQKVTVVR